MSFLFASDFPEIPAALAANAQLRERVVALITTQPMPGKVTEGGSRLATFRTILHELASGSVNVFQAIRRAEAELARTSSPHAADNRVFASGWAERLVRTQFSRFYNQAVLEHLTAAGVADCFVPHSASEKPDSQCSQLLAGRTHRVADLLGQLIGSYAEGRFSKQPKIPDHPHCTHVVRPVAAEESVAAQPPAPAPTEAV